MTKLEELLNLSPCKVLFTRHCYYNYGAYWDKTKAKHLFNPTIEIQKDLKEHEKLAVLVHEIAHANCDKNNCICWTTEDNVLREYHAYKYSLEWLLKNNCPEALKFTIKSIKSNSEIQDFEQHTQAAQRIVKLKLWQKCLDFIGE